MAERRPLVLGEWYREAEEVRAATEPGTPIDLVIRSEGDLLFAEMAETGLHLRDCRTFAGWEAWRRRERIRFHPDPRSVNQAPGPPPGPAQLVLAVRPDLGRLIEVVTPPQ